MEDKIIFDEDSGGVPLQRDHGSHGFARYLIMWGIVKDERGANYVLVGIIIVCLLASATLFVKNSSPGTAYGNLDTLKATRPELFKNNPLSTP